MEDLKKFTKQELIEKLANLSHLEDAIKAKDKELNTQNDKHRDIVREKDNQIKTLKETQQDQLKKLEEQLDEFKKAQTKNEADEKIKLEKEIESRVQNAIKAVQEENKVLRAYGDRRAAELSKIIGNHGALLKMLQGATDMAISLNEYMYEEFSKRG